MTDARRLADPLAAAAALPRGSGIVLRDYAMAKRPQLAKALRRVAAERRLVLLIGDDPALALTVGASGVHFPEHRRAAARRWRRRRPDWIVTVAAHSLAAAIAAARIGADAALVSPVFATESHPGARTLGPRHLASIVRRCGLPVYALGGIDARTVRRLAGTGIVGIAAIGALAVDERSSPDAP